MDSQPTHLAILNSVFSSDQGVRERDASPIDLGHNGIQFKVAAFDIDLIDQRIVNAIFWRSPTYTLHP